MGQQSALQEIRRQMKVAGRRQVFHVQMLGLQRGNGAQISQDVPPFTSGKNDSKAGLGFAAQLKNRRDFYPGGTQAVQCNLAEIVGSDTGTEAHLAAQRRQVMGHDRRGTAQRQNRLGGQQLALRGQSLRQAVQDQVEVQLAGNGNVKASHENLPSNNSAVHFHITTVFLLLYLSTINEMKRMYNDGI